ncbi:hypothetical protein ACP0HM_31200 [Escherichia coli]
MRNISIFKHKNANYLVQKNQRYVIFSLPLRSLPWLFTTAAGVVLGTDFRQQIPVGLPPSLHKLIAYYMQKRPVLHLCAYGTPVIFP